jgi:hypothetical protein
MATTATVTISSDINYSVVAEEDNNNVNRYQNALDYALTYNYGTGIANTGTNANSQVNLFVNSSGHISGGDSVTIDFKAYNKFTLGSNYTLEFDDLRGIVIENKSSGTGEILNVAATGTNAFTNLFNGGSGNMSINPLGTYIYTDMYGTDVTTSNKVLQINNYTSTGIDYEMIVVGVDTGLLSESIGTP